MKVISVLLAESATLALPLCSALNVPAASDRVTVMLSVGAMPVALMLLIILHLIPDADGPYDIVAELMGALPSGSYLVLAHPASDIRAAQMAEMTRRVNARMSGPAATMRDRAAITRFFDGLDLVEPGVVQPQQWRPEPGMLSPPQVTAWCGVARKR